MKRVYNSFVLVVVFDVIVLIVFIKSILSNMILLYWICLLLLLISLVPLIGGINIMYENYKDENKKE